MSDASSVCSSHSATSVSMMKMECPVCAKEIQTRAMFNHIRKLHPEELLKNTNRRWIEEAENGEPLRVYWTRVNDFDEEEITTIYACLSTNKTFTTALGCRQHFAKDKKVLKDHNKQIKELKKQYATYRKQKAKKAKKPEESPLTLALKANDPALARALWRGIQNTETTLKCCRMIAKRWEFHNDTPVYMYDSKHNMFEEVPYSKLYEAHDALMARIEKHRNEKCLTVKTLWDLFFDLEDCWRRDYRETLFDLSSSLRSIHPTFNHGINGDENVFYGFATEQMEGVDF